MGKSIAVKIFGDREGQFKSADGLSSEYFKQQKVKQGSDQLLELLCKLLVSNFVVKGLKIF